MTNAQFAIGSHLKVARSGYTHHGIYIGNGQVIHYEGFCEAFKYAPITCVSLLEFQGVAKQIQLVSYHRDELLYSPDEIVQRAKSRLGENRYSLLNNNCEHFASWCITGKSVSKQVNLVKRTLIGFATIGITLFAKASYAKQWISVLA